MMGSNFRPRGLLSFGVRYRQKVNLSKSVCPARKDTLLSNQLDNQED